MRIHTVASLAVIVSVFTGCADGAPTGVEATLAPEFSAVGLQQEVPLRGSGTAGVTRQDFAPGFPVEGSTFDGRCSVPSSWVIEFTGTGQITHMGAVCLTFEHCTQADLAAGTFAYTDGVFSYTAANGDQLQGTYGSGSAGMLSAEVVWWQDSFVIDGGTGRFAGASGGGTDRGTTEVVSGYTEYELEGVIVYDASMRSLR
jgi:hypothetical protein